MVNVPALRRKGGRGGWGVEGRSYLRTSGPPPHHGLGRKRGGSQVAIALEEGGRRERNLFTAVGKDGMSTAGYKRGGGLERKGAQTTSQNYEKFLLSKVRTCMMMMILCLTVL